MASHVEAHYDQTGDILYLVQRPLPPTRAHDAARGVTLRRDENGQTVGVTLDPGCAHVADPAATAELVAKFWRREPAEIQAAIEKALAPTQSQPARARRARPRR